jgi:hypothetical protein
MRPLFDRDENLVGWIGSGCKHIFDADMRWVGYIERKNAWRASDGDWIGPVIDGNIYDRTGRPIAWSNKASVHYRDTDIRLLG